MEGYQQSECNEFHTPQAPELEPQGYASQPASGLTWIEPAGQNAVVALLLGLFGFLPIPLIGFGHLYLGQKGKFYYFLVMGLATLLLLLLLFLPVVNAVAASISVIVKIALTLIAMIDAYQMGARLQEGKPVAAGECGLFTLPLAQPFIKEAVFVSDSPDAPAVYKARLNIPV